MSDEAQEDDLSEEEGEQGAEDAEPPVLDEETRARRSSAMTEIRAFGDPVLKSVASLVTEFDAELETEATRMIELMHDALGVGLAATQLGAMRRLLVFQAGPDAEPRALVNPRVEWTSELTISAEEGCLSLPRIVVDVARPLHARISGVDTSGESILLEASGLEARILQHEIDHLDGVLILDRTERVQRRASMKALREGEAFSPDMLEPPEEVATNPGAESAVEPAVESGVGSGAGSTGEGEPAEVSSRPS